MTSPGPASDTDRELLRSTARRLFTGEPDLAQIGAMGFTGLLTPELVGGTGWLPVEACVVAIEAGRALSNVVWADNTVAAAGLGSDPRWNDLRQEVLAGQVQAAVARATGLSAQGHGVFSGRIAVRGRQKPAVVVLLDERKATLIVDCRFSDVSLDLLDKPTGVLDTTRPNGILTFEHARAHTVPSVDPGHLSDAATLLYCADSLGALSATSALLRDHLVTRTAFGHPLASFQVIQHRLAELTVLEAACDALLRRAATALASGQSDARGLAAAAHSYFVRHVSAALDGCIQLAGGIGFTWEYPIHHALRRAVTNEFAVRSHRASLEELDQHTLHPDERTAGDFREHVRKVINTNVPFAAREGHRAPTSPGQEIALRDWYQKLYASGLIGGSWPEEWGGNPQHHPIHDLIVTEELIRARAPRPIDQVQLASHVLLRFGTLAQKEQYLPRIRSAEHIWCQLFSEPDCGSDLAGIKARGEQQPDGSWLLSGQKTWTTDGHWAQMGLALLRTSTGERRHDGLTAFIVPMNSPRLEIRPKMTIGGAYEFNDVFLDGVTLAPDLVLGNIGQGWAVAMSGLEIERLGVGGNVLLLDLLLQDLYRVAAATSDEGSPLMESSAVRHRVAALISEALAARAFVADHVDQALAGTEGPAAAAIAKILYTETYNLIARHGAELVTEYGPVSADVEEEAQRLLDAWLWSRALTISGGSSEVMRNIIAKRGLQLPQ